MPSQNTREIALVFSIKNGFKIHFSILFTSFECQNEEQK